MLRHCPSQFRSDAIADVLRANRGLKRGFLPVEGGYLDQTRTFLIGADWIERISAFHEKQHLEKVKRNSS